MHLNIVCNVYEEEKLHLNLTYINGFDIVSELRFQGVNMAGADLSKLDLRRINFK